MRNSAAELIRRLSPRHRLPRIIYNDDSVTLRNVAPPHDLSTVSAAVEYLSGTQVDCLCWCVGEQLAYSWPSKVIENIFSLYERGLQHGAKWASIDRDVMYSLYRQGIDYLPELIRRSHQSGLMFVASFRMNDTHLKSYPTSVLTPEFWKAHQQYRIWEATDGKCYYNAALDYSFVEVRRRYMSAIMEVARTYDVDGIELDFTRTPYLFQPSEAWKKRQILTRFVSNLRKRLDAIGNKRKKPFALVVRIPHDSRTLQNAGIDATAWIEAKLPTILVVSEMMIDLNQRLDSWRQLCHKHGTLLYPSVEAVPAYNRAEFYSTLPQSPIAPRHDGGGHTNLATELNLQRAAAQNFLSQQPDGVYLFNYACRVAEGKRSAMDDPGSLRQLVNVLKQVGSTATLRGQPRHYAYFRDLPIHVEVNRPRRFHQTIRFAVMGRDLQEYRATLRFRQVVEKSPHDDTDSIPRTRLAKGAIRYYLNDRPISESMIQRRKAPARRMRSGFVLPEHEMLQVDVAGKDLRDGENTLAFEMVRALRESDPYVYVYDLELDLTPAGKGKRRGAND